MKDTSWFLNKGENADTLSITIRKPSTVYLDEFFRLRCAPDILTKGIFCVNNPAKEISESMAVFNAVRKTVGDSVFHTPSNLLVSVGDGSTPRTAGLFAYRSKMTCVSIDPLAKKGWNVNRLSIIPKKIEDVTIGCDIPPWDYRILVACHSHAPLAIAVEKFKPHLVVAMECCVPQDIGENVSISFFNEYHDWGVWSDKRHIKVWELKWQEPKKKYTTSYTENRHSGV